MKRNKQRGLSDSFLKTWCVMFVAIGLLTVLSPANGEIFGGIDFPGGASSFTDAVIRYIPNYTPGGAVPTDPGYMNPAASFGPPDYPDPYSWISLGNGGLIELQFTDNVLTNSGSATADLHIFEVGPDVEAMFVAIRPTPATTVILGPGHDSNGDGFFEIGKVGGSTSSIDIDAFFPGYAPGTLLFDAVQLIDDIANGANYEAPTVGADIDAVGAIGTQSVPLDICIDIKPGSWPNPFNAKGKGNVPVAIIGAPGFDVMTVDPTTVTLAGLSPLKWSVDDTTQSDGECTDNINCFDATDPANFNWDHNGDGINDIYGGDGYLDLIFLFDTQELAAAIGEVPSGTSITLFLEGQTNGGTPFSAGDLMIVR